MKNNKKFLHALIFAVCYIAYTSTYVVRLNLSMASDQLTAVGGTITTGEYGILGGAFLVVYAIGRLINGGISDRCPPKYMLGAGLVCAGIANIAFSMLPPFAGMLLLWCANAWSQSMLWSSVLCVFAVTFGERAPKYTSYMVTSVAVGNIVGILLNTWIITVFGLQYAFIIPGGFTLIIGAVTFFVTRSVRLTGEKGKKVESLPIRELAKRRDLHLTIPTAFLHGMMKDNITAWMAKYFIFAYAINLAEASWFILFIPAAGFVGRMAYPALLKLCREREHVVSLVGFVLCFVFALPLCIGATHPIVSMLCLGMIYAAVSIINTTLLSIYPIRFREQGRVATVSGVMDFATYLGAGLSQMVYGFIISAVGYEPMYISWAIVSAASFVLTYILIKRIK